MCIKKLFKRNKVKPPDDPIVPIEPIMLDMEICNTSGLLRNDPCGDKWHIGKFERGTEPTDYCDQSYHLIPPPPPPEQPKLDPEYAYPRADLYGNVFAKCGLINKIEYPEQGFFDFLDWLADNNACNQVRAFLHGQWGEVTYPLVNMPHPYNEATGLFDIETINNEWLDTVLRRIEHTKKTGIRPRIITDYNVNHWGSHWLCNGRSHGWRGQQLYFDRDYGPWQWVHYATGRKEIPEYETGEIDKATRDEWVAQYKANMGYALWFYNLIYSTLEREFPGWCMYDHNEIQAGATFHTMKQNIMESYNIKRFRRTTSIPTDFITQNKANGYIWELHGIKDKAEYIKVRDELLDGGKNATWIACSDGYGDYWFQDKDMTLADAERRYSELLDAIYADDNLYQGNGWHLNKRGTASDFVKLKQRLEVPNRILKEKVDSILM